MENVEKPIFEAKNILSDNFSMEVLKLFGQIISSSNKFPSSIYKANKSLSWFGMDYKNIHAYPNDCILYQKEHENPNECSIYNKSRWKSNSNETKVEKGVPTKVLWYFTQLLRF